VELVNSQITFNRSYSKVKKILLFSVINIAIVAYMLNNSLTTRESNLYEKFNVERKDYKPSDIKHVVKTLKGQSYGSRLSQKEAVLLDIKADNLVKAEKNRHYEVTGEVYISKEYPIEDPPAAIDKSVTQNIISKVSLFYLVSFAIFCMVFASRQQAVIKSVCLISFIF